MSVIRSRPTAVLLSLLWLLTALGPVTAADPTPAPAGAADPPAGGPTVHADMLTQHADDAAAFTPGETPPALGTAGEGAVSTFGTNAGGIAALPNGLNQEVFGYLPYWMVSSPSKLAYLDYELLSTIAYFSVGARKQGTLAKTSGGEPTVGWAGWTSSAMSGVISKAHQRGVKVVLTVTMMAWDFDYSDMSTLLNTKSYRDRLATEIAEAVKARNADGVNLDFEPMPNSLESSYTTFVRKVKSELVRVGAGSYLTVATTGGAASWDEGYELVDNGDSNSHSLVSSGGANALMVMAYDFNWSGSSRAGGVAPIDSPYVLDSRDAMNAYTSKVAPSKLIWGVPYYGREWSTASSSVNAPTNHKLTSAAGTYTFHRSEAAKRGRRWDGTGQVPWYRFWNSAHGTWVQGYYDDSQSLDAKYDMVKNHGLRGVGIWHLLMDGSRRELWDRLAVEFTDLPFTDVEDSKFVNDIIWLAEEGITHGCSDTRFCPEGIVLRDQMASFLARALDLPPATKDWFDDDDGNKHESSINRLAEAGITVGCGGTDYCPKGAVARDQMATFIVRAVDDLPPSTKDWFTDDDGNRHEGRINRMAEADITRGCGGTKFCPSGLVTRQQMAAFLHRALGS